MDFLQNELQPELVGGDIPLLFRPNLWIQLDGYPVHFAVPTMLNDHYPQRWID